ncbi:MAG: EAL domain-containing protein [Eubacteriaceae bacterium]|nr:EAL domain-containing protein [Eubacteriaceae bacterium]
MTWNITAEWTSLLFLSALIAYSGSRLTASNILDTMFRAAEWVSLIAIILNIASTLMIYSYESIPIWITVAITTAYFVFTPIMPLIYFYYVVIMLHHKDTSFRLTSRWNLFSLPYIAYLILLIANFWSHNVFAILPNMGYVQGSHIYSTYIVFYFYCFSICILAAQSRRKVGNRVTAVMISFPLLALFFVMLQKFFTDVILTGTASVFSLLVLFLYFQNNRLARDGLTGLYNREALLEEVSRLVQREEGFGLAAVSLDGFKLINQRHGTHAGDSFLKEVGQSLMDLNGKKSAYRYSGDIFALITKPGETEQCINKVFTRFTEPFTADEIECKLSASMASVEHTGYKGEEDPISALDFALTEVKLAGEGKIVRYEKELISRKNRLRLIEETLRSALKEDGFYLCYQPIWSVSQNKFVCVEALLRLKETPMGKIYPDEFIPVAEATGLIIPITYMVLEKACKACAEFGGKMGSVSVNFPFVQFMEPGIEGRVMGIIEGAGISPSMIKLEITERVLLEENERVNSFLENMSKEGVLFSLDDFGIGYSNVEVMLRVPLDVIKLDRSLLLAGLNASQQGNFLEKLVAGFKDMGRMVVAEGVETEEQFDFVKKCGCDMVQGYYFARPMPQDELREFLSKESSYAEI